MKVMAKVGLGFAALVVLLGGLFLGRFMSLGLPHQDWSLQMIDLSGVPDGIYAGEYRIVPPFGVFAFYRTSRVRVEVADQRIVRITVLEPTELAKRLEALRDLVLSRQTVRIDALSAGTWSSRAYLKAVETAIRSAGR